MSSRPDPKIPKKIIFIMTDTQRWDMLGCYRETGLKTPCLDKLASQGMRFERAYTTQPVCGPARSAIFSGQYPHSNGTYTNGFPMYDYVKTLGQRLRDNGFHTAYMGKWHLDGGDYFGMGRCPDGWDADNWYDMRNYLEELTDEERLLSRQVETINNPGISREFTFGARCSGRAIDFLEKHGDEEFFLAVSYDEPHHPFLCPEPYASMYKDFVFEKSENVCDDLTGKPDYQRAWAGQSLYEDKQALEVRHPYLFGCNSFVDSEIGLVMDAIDRYASDALVIYTADHGDFLKSHSLSNKGPAAYDEIARIPLIIREPHAIKAGTVYEKPVSHINIAPTIMEYAGLPVPKVFEGKSLVPVFSDTSTAVQDAVFIEFGRYENELDGFGGFQPLRAVFDGRFKLVINLLCSDELYDLETDPGEMQNLILSKETAQIRDALHNRLLEWMNDTVDPMRGYYWERRPWRTDARAATWKYTNMTRQREHEEYEPRRLDYSTGLEIESAVQVKQV